MAAAIEYGLDGLTKVDTVHVHPFKHTCMIQMTFDMMCTSFSPLSLSLPLSLVVC